MVWNCFSENAMASAFLFLNGEILIYFMPEQV